MCEDLLTVHEINHIQMTSLQVIKIINETIISHLISKQTSSLLNIYIFMKTEDNKNKYL